MPQVGAALRAERLLRVRNWILNGAEPDDPADIALPLPDSGFQIRIDPFAVPPGDEVQREYYFKAPNDQELVATRLEFLYPPGSHHFNLFTCDTTSYADGFDETFDANPFQDCTLRGSSQRIASTGPSPRASAFSSIPTSR